MCRGSKSHCQPTTIFSLAIQINCENLLKELILIEYPCRHWCHMKFSIHQLYEFTLPIPMWQEICKGILCPIRFVYFTSILKHEMCRGSKSHCWSTLGPSLAGQLVLSGWPTCVTWLATTLCWSASLAGQNTCLPRHKHLSSSAK